MACTCAGAKSEFQLDADCDISYIRNAALRWCRLEASKSKAKSGEWRARVRIAWNWRPTMVNYMLMITADLENLTNLQPQGGCDDPNFSYFFKVSLSSSFRALPFSFYSLFFRLIFSIFIIATYFCIALSYWPWFWFLPAIFLLVFPHYSFLFSSRDIFISSLADNFLTLYLFHFDFLHSTCFYFMCVVFVLVFSSVDEG